MEGTNPSPLLLGKARVTAKGPAEGTRAKGQQAESGRDVPGSWHDVSHVVTQWLYVERM